MAESNTLSVGCKLPHGLVVEHGGRTVKLNGAYSQDITNQNGRLLMHTHGLTHGVDKAWFEDWRNAMTKTKDGAEITEGLGQLFANGVIFDATNPGTATNAAKSAERRSVTTGLEGLDPTKPTPGVEPTDEQRQALRNAEDGDKDDADRPPRMR